MKAFLLQSLRDIKLMLKYINILPSVTVTVIYVGSSHSTIFWMTGCAKCGEFYIQHEFSQWVLVD